MIEYINFVRRSARLMFMGWLALWAVFHGTEAAAHPLNNGYSKIRIDGKSLNYELFIPEDSLLFLDRNGDRHILQEELAAGRSDLEDYLRSNLQLENETADLHMTLVSTDLENRDGVPGISMKMDFDSRLPITSLTIYYNLLFDDIDPNHLNFAVISDNRMTDQYVFKADDRTYTMDRPDGVWEIASMYANLGIRHILGGYDHLLFLITLLIAAVSWKDTLGIVTAFTAAHSITLTAAAAHLVSVPFRIAEAGIALTICYAAAANLFVKHPGRRWIPAFLLGLIHGLGFAGALGEIGLPENHFLGSLLSFNFGVEIGQLGVVLVLLPLLLWLRRYSWYYRYIVTAGSCIIFIVALYWFVERI